MAFKKGGFDLTIFVLIIISLFVKNIFQEYLYQYWGVAEWNVLKSGLFAAFFENIEWLLFWIYFRNIFEQRWKLAVMFILTAVFTTIPDFLSHPLLSLDNDNLLIKALFYFIPFSIFLGLKRSYGQVFLPFMMAFIPLVNLEIANGFIGNFSFFQFLPVSDFLQIELDNFIFIDVKMAMIKAMFWAAFAVLFYEISHQVFAIKSWRLQVELPLTKGYVVLVYIVFKSLIYWLIGSLIIALLGNVSLPLFTNKVGLLLNTTGFFAYLIISILYFRKYITMYFYDKCGHTNWLYPFLFIPFFDFIAVLILVLFPARYIKRFFSVKYSKELLVGLVSLVLVIYAVYAYLTSIKDLAETDFELRRGLLLAQVAFPLIASLGIFFSLKSKWFFRALVLFFFMMYPVFLFVIIPSIEGGLKIENLVNIVGTTVLIGVTLSFLYPVVNFRSFLKLN